MRPRVIELVPNRQLLDSNFDGYKLSLQEITRKQRDLNIPVDRVLLNTHQYSLLHANLYGFHNHLIVDPFDEINSVYYINAEFNVCKVYIDPLSDELMEPIIVLQLPRHRERQVGDYNVSLKFVSPSVAVIGDGIGNLYIANTGNRNDDDIFSICFSDEVAGQDESFLLVDAVLKIDEDNHEKLNVLALSLKQENENGRFFTLLHWITFSKIQNVWGQIALKQIKNKGCLQYSYLQNSCEAIYIVSETESKFTINSDVPIVEDAPICVDRVYTWSQNNEDIVIKIPLSPETVKQHIYVCTQNTHIEVKSGDKILILGDLYQKIDPNMTTWTFEQGTLEITLCKEEIGLMWPEVVKNDATGEHVINTCITELSGGLQHLTSENEAVHQSGSIFNSQQVEECDFESDKNYIFERLYGQTNSTTHKVNLGSHQVALSVLLNPDTVPAIGIRHDVDICLWHPQETGTFSMSHEGTLLALGYVQASKQNRKFTVCPPNLSYAAICESSGHLFIYRQNKPISTTELRNRNTGRRIQNIAQQQVVNFSNEEVLGIYASNNNLFLLCEKSLTVLNL